MSRGNYSKINSWIHWTASTRPGIWFFSRILHHIDRALLKLTKNKTTLTGLLAGLPIVILYATGAKSGLAREVPLVYIEDETDPNRFALVASNYGQRHHPTWYFNLKANPQAICSLKGRSGVYNAHEAVRDEYDRFWQAALETYPGYHNYQKLAGGRRIPIVVMTKTEA